ncbi:tyrosine-type recombinase/integrase [Ruficoccus amylovorans]|uniref:Tyrosine-type recombinase/integrase n=1 Tax=Ruficoccus amylovorans TaxID=1804625 RepID=A0A842HD52_9BACT|nr:tyrosine-type recombinase/integrase [Ruficoccus amylovorans]MBC2594423.1 tyrosine-type recombinase/integrase [Ruficoccus amylovorans]
MASIWKHPRSRYWSACFTDASGRQRKRSTKETDRKKALKIAEAWEKEYRVTRTEEQTRKVFAEIRREIHGETTLDQSIEQYLQEWLTSKKKEISGATWSKYEYAVRHFCDWLGETREKDLSALTPALIRRWRDALAEKLAAKTVNNALKVLGVALGQAESSEQIERNPVSKVNSLKLDTVTRPTFTLPQLKRILSVAKGEWYGMTLAGLYTGQRLRDIATLTWGSVDREREELTLITSKTGRTVGIPIASPLMDYLRKEPTPIDGGVPVFPDAYRTVVEQDRTGTLSNQFYGILVNAGLAKPRSKKSTGTGHSGPRERGGLSFHCLRHTATSLLKNAGVSEAVAMDIIGHDSKAISTLYTHIEVDAKRQAISKLPDVTSGSLSSGQQ